MLSRAKLVFIRNVGCLSCRTVTYGIDPDSSNGDWRHFEIDSKEGTIRSKSSFDREQKSKFTLSVLSSDGYPSSIPGISGANTNRIYVRIEIGDKNDNVPYFEQPLYEASVQESAPVGHTIMQVRGSKIVMKITP